MSKVKNWAWDCAEKKLDEVVEKVENGLLTQSQAVKEIKDFFKFMADGFEIFFLHRV